MDIRFYRTFWGAKSSFLQFAAEAKADGLSCTARWMNTVST